MDTAVTPLYTPRNAEITAVNDLTPQEKLFRIRLCDGSNLGHLPGQFIQLSLPGFTEAPISVSSPPSTTGYFELAIRAAGSLTCEMHRKIPGDTVGIRGPFGNPFPLQSLNKRDLLLISGGCGLAPMRSLILHCAGHRESFGNIQILYGARSPENLLFKEELSLWQTAPQFNCQVTVDNAPQGSCYDGATGYVHTLVKNSTVAPESAVAVVVGPPVMYRAVIEALQEFGISGDRTYLSLERQMRCGVGKCGHCAIEHLYCCTDGPVFRLDRIADLPGWL